MCISAYDTRDKRLQWKEKSEAHLKRAIDKSNSAFFPATKLSSTTAAKSHPVQIHHSRRNRCQYVDTISLKEEEAQDPRQTPAVRRPPRLTSTPVSVAPSATLPVTNETTSVPTHAQTAQRREQQRQLNDEVRDAFNLFTVQRRECSGDAGNC